MLGNGNLSEMSSLSCTEIQLTLNGRDKARIDFVPRLFINLEEQKTTISFNRYASVLIDESRRKVIKINWNRDFMIKWLNFFTFEKSDMSIDLMISSKSSAQKIRTQQVCDFNWINISAKRSFEFLINVLKLPFKFAFKLSYINKVYFTR